MTRNQQQYSMRFMGTGSGGDLAMGSSAAVLEHNNQPLLLIDCGPGTLNAYVQTYQSLPSVMYITHCHLDHIADLEILTVRVKLQQCAPVKLYVPVGLIPLLHQRLATYPGAMAEGGHNFWDSFQLIPVSDHFEINDLTFRLYPARHHQPGSAFSLHLADVFFYSGDTRPIPEVLSHVLSGRETIFHDCGLIPNPSHTGLADLEREYDAELLRRFVLYHYADEAAATALEESGLRVARPGSGYTL